MASRTFEHARLFQTTAGVIACTLLAGCGAVPVQDADGNDARSFEVISDVGEISTARAEFESELRDLISAERLAQMTWFDFEAEAVLKRHPEITLLGLNAILERADAEELVRLNAAVLRAKIAGTSVEDAAAPFVLSEDPSVVGLALNHLRYPAWDEVEHRIPESIHDRLLALMSSDDAQVRQAALFLCANHRVPGVLAKLEQVLENGPERERLEAGYWLSRIDPTAGHLEGTIELYAQTGGNHRALVAVSNCLEAPSPEVRSRATEFLIGILEPKLKTANSFEMPQSVCADVLRSGSKAATREFIEEVLASSSDNYLRGLAVESIARIDGRTARDRLLVFLEDPYLQSYAARSLADLFSGTSDEEISAAFITLAGSDLESWRRAEFISASIAIGRDKGDPEILSLVERLDPPDRQAFLAADFESWLGGLTARLDELGVAEPERVRTVREQWLAKPAEERAIDTLGVLYDCGVAVFFDAETGMIPVRHDLLLYDFADASRGNFVPEAPSEMMFQDGPDDYDGDYVVQFISGDRLYRFGARNYGDWYDVEAVQDAVNRALADLGAPERFVALDSGDQTAMFLFGSDALSVLTEEYGIPLGSDPDQAMKAGKAYERRVIDQISSGEGEGVVVK